MSDETTITNERLYYELRAHHRRMIGLMVIMSAFAGIAVLGIVMEDVTILYSTAALATVAAALGYLWLLANVGYSWARWAMDKLITTDSAGAWWPEDIRRDLEERGEL